MTKILYLDAETKKWSDEVEGGFDNVPAFGLSILCTYDTESGKYRTWMEHNIKELESILLAQDLIIGFNIMRFDYPLIQQFFDTVLEELPTFDMMLEVMELIGKRLSLDNLAKTTLGTQKQGNGKLAVQWWKECELTQLENYCRTDVKVTKELFEYGCRNNHLNYIAPGSFEHTELNTDYWARKARSLVEKAECPF